MHININIIDNSKLSSDLQGVAKSIVEIAVEGANRNLKLSEYYVLSSQSKIYDQHMVQKEIAAKKCCKCQNMRKS